MQGGPTFWVAGDVAGSMNLAAATSMTTDGTTTTTPAGARNGYGSQPALLIGSGANSVTLGSVAGDAGNFGLVLGGNVGGNGVYNGVQTTAVQLGGLGGAVNITNGIRVGGTIAATANGASAVGFRMASGAQAPTLVNTGTISSTILAPGTETNPVATGLLIDTGSSLPTLVNNGTISAAGVTGASTFAIRDRTGTLTNMHLSMHTAHP